MENHNSEDLKYMKLALDEAVKAAGRTSPNPLVGAVVVNNGRVVGRGYHKKAGTAHAEINALAEAGPKAHGATIYVTLEPCNHHGRTGPCTEAILKNGLRRVVVGMPDPNPSVAGGGNLFLTQNGLQVTCGVLEEECQRINRPFVKWITQKKPWVIVKAGVSLDGKIASSSAEQLWITSESSRAYVHQVRDQVDAILIGVGTALADDPALTCRISGKSTQDPIRVVLDSHLRLPPESKLLNQKSAAKTIVFCGEHVTDDQLKPFSGVNADIERTVRGIDGQINLEVVLSALAQRQVTSILVEGGGQIHASFIRNHLADQAMLFYGPIFVGDQGVSLVGGKVRGGNGTFPRLVQVSTKQFDNDVLIEGLFE
nr:bifunctional diaminohydroxyphosphoribosylaminopyrimidine deaminase/5-amino-6-(5-phosphoribosylamino)uracil reductase RibD [Desulfobulbaceae bacterium]